MRQSSALTSLHTKLPVEENYFTSVHLDKQLLIDPFRNVEPNVCSLAASALKVELNQLIMKHLYYPSNKDY